MNYADQMCDWLVEEGYTHCFFVAGGNIMHLLNSARTRFVCVPFVHEVAAGIAAEYFNEAAPDGEGRAFAMVTAGPGLTNIVTAMAGAFLESRELLVIGGQVKTADLSGGGLRQRGIQEVDGIAIASPVVKAVVRLETPLGQRAFKDIVSLVSVGRPGPVFVEVCLDVQGGPPAASENSTSAGEWRQPTLANQSTYDNAVTLMVTAQRPLLLLGGGISREAAPEIIEQARLLGLPVATTWNGADRIAFDDALYAGRPNTWGMRWANLVLQQADVILAAGTRLGLQQTGFNWQEFAPVGKVIHIDIDPLELEKGHPVTEVAICADADTSVTRILGALVEKTDGTSAANWRVWRQLIQELRSGLPLADPANQTAFGFVDPYTFVELLSSITPCDAVVVPCSSGGAFTVTMQAFLNKRGQVIITDKGLASMGYGLSGAVGAALANPDKPVILLEGDGGFAQNLQELGTLARQSLNVKVFLFSNEGYASIRMTQRTYFDGAYLGCDIPTGLGMPDWHALFTAYGIPCVTLEPEAAFSEQLPGALHQPGPAAFIVPIDPEQTYFPRISSQVRDDGTMSSNPLHRMSPDLTDETFARLAPHLGYVGGIRN
jgi:acetolactate synthase-1/2/3 large subunit